MHGRDGTSGVDWAQATKVGYSLLLSPLVGFVLRGAAVAGARARWSRIAALYEEPKGKTPPPLWIRGILILTCTGVSLRARLERRTEGHGADHADPDRHGAAGLCAEPRDAREQMTQFVAVAQVTQRSLDKNAPAPTPADPRKTLTEYVRTQEFKPDVVSGAGRRDRQHRRRRSRSTARSSSVPAEAVANVRNDMYLASEAIRLLPEERRRQASTPETQANLKAFKKQIDDATKFIPIWVKVAVAIALGLGTMVGWKRIVVTVGEKIGKTHLTYAQGASAELVAMAPSARPTCTACRSRPRTCSRRASPARWPPTGPGLQMATIRNLLLAWVLTLPAAILLSGSLYWLFSHLF